MHAVFNPGCGGGGGGGGGASFLRGCGNRSQQAQEWNLVLHYITAATGIRGVWRVCGSLACHAYTHVVAIFRVHRTAVETVIRR